MCKIGKVCGAIVQFSVVCKCTEVDKEGKTRMMTEIARNTISELALLHVFSLLAMDICENKY